MQHNNTLSDCMILYKINNWPTGPVPIESDSNFNKKVKPFQLALKRSAEWICAYRIYVYVFYNWNLWSWIW